ncbi:hypothetical protein ACFS6H_02730 [Terrimonas rubra]|uniref:Uncharacterized protein n=1 Tax=Terrimonas rubra TaxID=1035890 RepID=A0ABW6A3X4_9BACT
MTPSTEILNWLVIGFEQPTGSLTEFFYYDKHDREFFSIMAVDYFMLDEEMNIAGNVTTNYSKTQTNTLVERMKKIENDDPSIIPVPRVTLDDPKNVMQQFLGTLSDQKLIDRLNQQTQTQNYKTKFDFYFEDETEELIKQNWEKAKSTFLHQQIDTFLNLNNINIAHSTLWVVDSEGSISIDLTKDSNSTLIIDKTKTKKRWWKFWQ